MSLTEAENLFASVHETGLNDLLTAFFRARPQMSNYRTSPAVANTPPAASSWTTIPLLTFPGAGGIEHAVQFSIPQVDIVPGGAPLPPPLVLDAEQFALSTTVIFSLLCRRAGQERDSVIRLELGVAAIGRFVRRGGAGADTVGVELLDIEIVDIAPDALESMVECLVLTLLGAALSAFQIPLAALPVPGVGVTLNLVRGPDTEEDQFKLYGTVV